MQELEKRQGLLLEENRATSEEHDRKVAELTQREDEVGSLRRRLEESERARAVDKVCFVFLNLLILVLYGDLVGLSSLEAADGYGKRQSHCRQILRRAEGSMSRA